MELFSQHSSMRRADHSGFPCRRGLLIEGNIVVVGASGSGLASKKPGEQLMDLRLKDKAVLITGSSRGIGLASAKAFAAEGCRIVLSARSTGGLAEAEAVLRAGGAAVAAQVADVTQPEQAAQLVEAACAAFGGIDILVNNVGGGRGGPHIVDSIDE